MSRTKTVVDGYVQRFNPSLGVKDRFAVAGDADFHMASRSFWDWGNGMGMSRLMIEQCIERAADDIAAASEVCESPLERAMLPWLVFADYGLQRPARIHMPKTDAGCQPGEVVIVPQFAFMKYRLDFAVAVWGKWGCRFFAMECDGTAYHDADKDAERDRYLSSWNISTFRSHGQQLNRNPEQAASEFAYCIKAWVGER